MTRINSIPTSALCALLALTAASPQVRAEDATPGYAWLPDAAAGAGLAAAEGAPRVVLPVTITKTPKATADASKFTRPYVVELAKFGISSTGTDAKATSQGLNAALQHAKTLDVNRIVFPKGTYLMDVTIPLVINHKNTVIDLNGSTLQVETNGLPNYSMVNIGAGSANVRLTNGTLRGDRDTHDYKTIQSTHEHCSLLTFYSGNEVEVDHLTVVDAPGFAVVSRVHGATSRPELLAMIFHSVMFKDLEQGAFSATGEKVPGTTKTRSSKPYDISKCGGAFEFGYTPGYMGFPFIKDRHYQVLFYDENMKFLERRDVFQFRKVQIPAGAKFLNLEFNQGEVSTTPAHAGATNEGYCGRITNFNSPTNVHFHDNVVSRNRGLGMAFCGGQKWVIENNLWEKNGGQAPSYAIDFEDGWEMMQDVVLRNNVFKGNDHDLVVCAGTELLFEGNQFEKTVFFYGRTYNYTLRHNTFNGDSVGFNTRSGVLRIHDNTYRNLNYLSMNFDGKGVADGFVRAEGSKLQTPPITLVNEDIQGVKQVSGTYFKLVDAKVKNAKFVAGKETMLAQFEGCEFADSSLTYEKEGPEVLSISRGNAGELKEGGPGLARRKTAAAKP